LAQSGGYPVFADLAAQGGWTLSQHVSSADTQKKINERKWDYVVLQEQSVVPSVLNSRTSEMYPAVRALNEKIQQTGAQPLLYMTWGRKNGFPDVGFADFSSMQEQLILGYMGIANELGMGVAPVGAAWKTSRERKPELELWQADGSHPSISGSYLAACVFYAVLYQKSPEGLKYPEQLPGDTAKFLQSLAAETILTDPKLWNIHPAPTPTAVQ
jgi:hypothetical protein